MARTAKFVGMFLFILAAVTAQAQSPREQLTQLVAQLQATPADDALRQKIINLALTLTPKPALPMAVDEQVGAATYAFKNAVSESDFAAAAQLYAKAALLAPWAPDYYFNQGVALEKAKYFDKAIAAFNWYLMAAPDAQDARDVRERIGGLKFALQQVSEAHAAQAAQQDEQQAKARREAQFYSNFDGGVWRLEAHSTTKDGSFYSADTGSAGVGRCYIVVHSQEMTAYLLMLKTNEHFADRADFARKVAYNDTTAWRSDYFKVIFTSRYFQVDDIDPNNQGPNAGRQDLKIYVTISEDSRTITTEDTYNSVGEGLFKETRIYRRIK
ncbi:MAG TPA: tetratricopeptide repeat protein [Candidatus Angelobacter sp.]